MAARLRVAVVGLGFGAEFVPIYLHHPEAELTGICDVNEANLTSMGDAYGVPLGARYTSYADVLASSEIDAVHLLTPPGTHSSLTLAALEAGKHVACTVPMGVTPEECAEICRKVADTGLTYMMMETAVYTREFLFVQEMSVKGELGRIQFLRGSHQQDMTVGWPEYWWGFPPMHYATHAVAPLFSLANAAPEQVSCLGSGRIREEYVERYGSPFAVETALFRLRDSDIACEATRSLYETVRQYQESFDVYGERLSFEWEQVIGGHPVIFTGGENAEKRMVPDYGHLLPKEIASFTQQGVYGEDTATQHLSFLQGGGHGGSHPHLVNEFIRCILDERPPAIDAPTAAGWTTAGLFAHQSAMNGGRPVSIPDFRVV